MEVVVVVVVAEPTQSRNLVVVTAWVAEVMIVIVHLVNSRIELHRAIAAAGATSASDTGTDCFLIVQSHPH